jgi:hypothetical protein
MDNSGIAFIAAYLMCHRTAHENSSNCTDGHYVVTRSLTNQEAVTEAIALVDEVERQLGIRREMQPTYRIDPGSVKRNPRKKGKGCRKS